jgi:hypothetical protein
MISFYETIKNSPKGPFIELFYSSGVKSATQMSQTGLIAANLAVILHALKNTARVSQPIINHRWGPVFS